VLPWISPEVTELDWLVDLALPWLMTFVEVALKVVSLWIIVFVCARLEREVLVDRAFDIEATDVGKEALVPNSLVVRTVEVARIGFDDPETDPDDATVEEELCTLLLSAFDVFGADSMDDVAATVEF